MPTKCLKSDFFKVLSTWKWNCASQDVWSKGSIITPNIYEFVWCGQRTAQEILLEFVVSSVALLSVNGASSMAETTLFSLTIARSHQSFQSNPRCPRKVLNWNCNCRNQKGSDKFNLFSQIARSTKIRICVLLRIFAYFCGLFAYFLRFTKNKKMSKNRFKKIK